jgi:hypothetical protein
MRPGRSPCSHRSISTAPLAGPQMWQISGSRVIRQMTRSRLVLNRFAVDCEGDTPFGRAIANTQPFACAETEFPRDSRSIESP